MTSPLPSSRRSSAGIAHPRANQTRLVAGQLLGGIGIASGVAVGGLLAEEISGTASAN